VTAIDRRSVVRGVLLAGAAAVTAGLVLVPETAESRVVVRRGPVRRTVVVAPRRRYWHCAYVNGNRVCNWRYY
jgi:hypothetical protein